MAHTWFENYEVLKEYYNNYGSTRITVNVTYNNCSIGRFCARCRREFKLGKLSEEQVKLLNEIDFSFDPYDDDWNNFYRLAEKYYNENGHLLVSEKELIDGVKLGKWISLQRVVKNRGKLIAERENKLNQIGMVWDPSEYVWEEYFLEAKKYFDTYGNLDISINYEVGNKKLGRWISNQRTAYRNPNDSHKISYDKIDRLNSIGMLWEAPKAKKSSFPECALFYYFRQIFEDAKGNDRTLGVEVDCLSKKNGIAIEYDGRVFHQDEKRDIAKNEYLISKYPNIRIYRFREKGCPKLLDSCSYNIEVEIVDNYEYLSKIYSETLGEITKELGIKCIDVDIYRDIDEIIKLYGKTNDKFDFWYEEAKKYKEINGTLIIKSDDLSNQSLNGFFNRCRQARRGKKGKISKNQIIKMDELGFIWNPREYEFERKFSLLEEYFNANNNLLVTNGTIIAGENLGNFVSVLRTKYKKGKMPKDIIDRLENIGMVWKVKDESWEKYYDTAYDLFDTTGNINVGRYCVYKNVKIGDWLYKQRAAYWKTEQRYINQYRINKLEKIGIDWKKECFIQDGISYNEKQWMYKYSLVKEYVNEYGIDSLISRTEYKGVKIGKWISKQRLKKEKLDQEKTDKLRKLGIKLSVFDEEWDEMFNLVKEYVENEGWENLIQNTKFKGKNIGKWVDTRRQEKRGNRGTPGITLNDIRIKKLEEIGIIW